MRKFKATQSRICWFEEKRWDKLMKKGLIWFSQLFALFDDGYNLLVMCGKVLVLIRCYLEVILILTS